MTTHTFCIEASQQGQRIDKWLPETLPALTRSMAAKLCEDGCVFANGKPVSKNYKLRAGDALRVSLPAPRPLDVRAQDIPLPVIYEDDDLLVVDKPKGMVVHPAPGNPDGTLVNALLHHCAGSLSGINGVIRPGIVHRIDKDTSGLLIVAKNDRAHLSLAEQIKAHSFTRAYEAVVYGSLKSDSGTVDAPIARSETDRKKMCVSRRDNARRAVTHYEVLARYRGFTHLRLRLETGRTHQIRVHMAYLGHPVAGDPVYGPKAVIRQLGGQCLHAREIGFVHPATGAWMQFSSELPPYFTEFLAKLRRETGC